MIIELKKFLNSASDIQIREFIKLYIEYQEIAETLPEFLGVSSYFSDKVTNGEIKQPPAALNEYLTFTENGFYIETILSGNNHRETLENREMYEGKFEFDLSFKLLTDSDKARYFADYTDFDLLTVDLGASLAILFLDRVLKGSRFRITEENRKEWSDIGVDLDGLGLQFLGTYTVF